MSNVEYNNNNIILGTRCCYNILLHPSKNCKKRVSDNNFILKCKTHHNSLKYFNYVQMQQKTIELNPGHVSSTTGASCKIVSFRNLLFVLSCCPTILNYNIIIYIKDFRWKPVYITVQMVLQYCHTCVVKT